YFFFQAEDGIRDFHVTGVQTCALPIFFFIAYPSPCLLNLAKLLCCQVVWRDVASSRSSSFTHIASVAHVNIISQILQTDALSSRSEERREGKECRSRWSTHDEKKKIEE